MSKKRKRRKNTAKPVVPKDTQGKTRNQDASVPVTDEQDESVDATASDAVASVSDDSAGDSPKTTETFLRRLWASPAYDMFMRIYELGVYSVGGGLCVAMVAARCGANGAVQWVLGITVVLAVVLSKTVFAGELGSIYDEAREKVEEDRRRDQEELANGNFDGVPKVMQDLLKYPTEEDYQKVYKESKRQRGLLRDWESRKDRDGDESGKSE